MVVITSVAKAGRGEEGGGGGLSAGLRPSSCFAKCKAKSARDYKCRNGERIGPRSESGLCMHRVREQAYGFVPFQFLTDLTQLRWWKCPAHDR